MKYAIIEGFTIARLFRNNRRLKTDFHLHTKADKEFKKYDDADINFVKEFIVKIPDEDIVFRLNAKPSFFTYSFTLTILCVFLLTLAGCASDPVPIGGPLHSTDAAEAEPLARSITGIKVETFGKITFLKIISTVPFHYTSSMLNKRRLLILELTGVNSRLSTVPISGNMLENIRVFNILDKRETVKVEITLKMASDYDLFMDGTSLAIALTPRAHAKPASETTFSKKEIEEMDVNRLKAELNQVKQKTALIEERLNQYGSSTGKQSPLSLTQPMLRKKTPGRYLETPEPGRFLIKRPVNILKSEILVMVEKWRQAWQSKDFPTYAGFYAESFHQNGKDKNAWIFSKKDTFEVSGEITVEIKDIRVEIKGEMALAGFTQTYKSGLHKDTGVKILFLRNIGQGWKITSESWNPIE